MTYDPDRHRPHSIRLQNYDYGQAGAYYVTICTHNRLCLFANIQDGLLQLTSLGEAAQEHWLSLPNHHSTLDLDEFIMMPNHLHGILVIQNQIPSTLFDILRGYKSFSARQINRLRQMKNAPVWQERYYDHIIRDEADLNRIRTYIVENPLRWSDDDYYIE